MNLERYDYVKSPNKQEYTFYSEGPKGRIKKLVRFQPFVGKTNIYNLVLGDGNESDSSIDDKVTTDNLDTDKVLATVAVIVLEFCRLFPDTFVLATGSTLSRTRLYQIKINRQLLLIARSPSQIFPSPKIPVFTTFTPKLSIMKKEDMTKEEVLLLEELLNLPEAKIDYDMQTHENDPLVVRETQEAYELLKKVKNFPPEWNLKF